MTTAREYIILPFVVAIDRREQSPWQFRGMQSDAKHGRVPLVIPIELKTLKTCDYSIVGHEAKIGVERKSRGDFVMSLIQERDRFRREFERMQEMERTYVVVESDWASILNEPIPHSKVSPKSLFRTVVSWQDEFPKTHWWFCPGRAMAEHATLRILQKYYEHRTSATKSMPTAIDS